jgi:hypothetical protein
MTPEHFQSDRGFKVYPRMSGWFPTSFKLEGCSGTVSNESLEGQGSIFPAPFLENFCLQSIRNRIKLTLSKSYIKGLFGYFSLVAKIRSTIL